MKKEVRIFLTALMFLTRLPVYRFADHDPAYLEKASKYFPLAGWIVGLIGGGIFILFQSFTSIDIAILASMIAGILATGAFHEDGFADCCDAFGGGWTKEKILDIMKDSRLGTFGTIGLIMILAAKFLLLREILGLWSNDFSLLTILLFLVSAHAISRFMPLIAIQFSKYVFREDLTKSKPLASNRLKGKEMLLALLTGIVPMICLPLSSWLALPVIMLATFLLIRYFERWIGGYTGDCLGAIQQVTEISFYLSCLIVWKFI